MNQSSRTIVWEYDYTSEVRAWYNIKGVPSVESSRSVRGLGKGVSGKPYPCLCNARRPRLEPGTFRSHAVRLYRLHQARPSKKISGPLKCRIFVASHSKLLLDSQQIGYKQGSPHPASCPLYDQASENIQHILVSCMVAREVWSAT